MGRKPWYLFGLLMIVLLSACNSGQVKQIVPEQPVTSDVISISKQPATPASTRTPGLSTTPLPGNHTPHKKPYVPPTATPKLTPTHTPIIPLAPGTIYPANIDFEPGGYGTYNPAALASSNIGAVDVNMNWFAVEPQQGVFNWGLADNEVAAWAQQRKKFTLIVRYANESGLTAGTACSAFQFLPSWEIPRIQHFCDTDRRTIIPDYFDPTFQADLKTYVKAIANHFANNPYRNSLEYVRVGVGLAGEGFPLMPCYGGGCSIADYQADQNQLVSWGYSPQHWETWQESMLSYFKSVFSYTTVIYPIVQLDTNPATGNPVQMDVAYWAAAQGMGVGAQGLVPIPNYPYARLNVIIPYILSHYPNTYIQFQTVAAVSSATDIQGDINTANGYGARSIEWYSQDAINPSCQQYFQRWQQTVDSKF